MRLLLDEMLSPAAQSGVGADVPGNDFWLFDDELLVFLVFAGNGLVVDRPTRTDPGLIARCRASFEAAWALSIPHHEYTPALS